MLKRLLLRPSFRLVFALLWLGGTAIACGFSGILGSKMDVTLNRKRPPQVYIMGDAISVRAKSKLSKGSQYCEPMARMLETALIEQNRRLKPEHSNPQTIVSLEITQLESNEKPEERRSKRQKKTGVRQVWNEKNKRYENKDLYEEVEVRENYKVVTGLMNVSYQVTDLKTRKMLDSGNFPAAFNQSFLDGNGAPSLSEVENQLVRIIVNRIVPRLVPTIEPVKVLLAQCKLKDIAKFGEAGLWQRMVEAYEAMPPLKDSKDDAYRLYNIAVGYEAQAYKAEDIATSRKLLDKAAVLYGQALEAKPSEKYFREPQMRIEQAITQYRKLEDQLVEYSKAQPPPQPPGQTGSGSEGKGGKDVSPAKPSAPGPMRRTDAPLTNQDIIGLASKGMDEANLIVTINEAKAVNFDFTPQSLGDLLQNKVSNKVITVMRAKQNAAQKPSTRRDRPKKNR